MTKEFKYSLVQPLSKINPRVDHIFKNKFSNHCIENSKLVLILSSKRSVSKHVIFKDQPLCWSYLPKWILNLYIQRSILVLVLSSKMDFKSKKIWIFFIFKRSTLVLVLSSKKIFYIQRSTLVLVLSSKIDFKSLYSKINPCVGLNLSKWFRIIQKSILVLILNHYIQRSTPVLVLSSKIGF